MTGIRELSSDRRRRGHLLRSATSLLAMAGANACSSGDDAPQTPSNSAPAFSSSTTASFQENATGVAYRAEAQDADGDAIQFTLSGGADAGLFLISSDGAVSFRTTPNFEAPTDAGADNVYDIVVRASDGVASTDRAVAITVTNLVEGIALRRAGTGFNSPLFALARGDGSNRLLVVEKTGRIEILDLASGAIASTPFLDISGDVSTDGERGLLGAALAPDFATSGNIYVSVTNLAGDTEVRRYSLAPGAQAIDPSTRDVILRAAQPATNHNGGWLDFGPDGLLYIAIGDGGGSNDQFGNGQNPSTLLGSILRIDVRTDSFPGDDFRDYAIPAANPFVAGGGAPEVLAFGLRNPFRCSFDSATGDLFIGDVGQGNREEISLIPAGSGGQNFGWPILEGTRVNAPGSTAGMTPPIIEYAHGSGERSGRSITGGYVSRGAAEAIAGRYVFSDFVSSNVWAVPTATVSQGTTIQSSAFEVLNSALTPDFGAVDNVASFGVGADGSLFIVDFDGDVFRIVERS